MNDEDKTTPNLSILLVDDNGSILEIIKDILVRGLNAKVDLASTGQIAFSKLREKNYDLIITDLIMPDIDGEHLVSSVRAGQVLNTDEMKSIPIIIISGRPIEGELLTQLNAHSFAKSNLNDLPGYISYILFEK